MGTFNFLISKGLRPGLRSGEFPTQSLVSALTWMTSVVRVWPLQHHFTSPRFQVAASGALSASTRSLVPRAARQAEPAVGHSLSVCCVGNALLFPVLHWTDPLSVGLPPAELRPPLQLSVSLILAARGSSEHG